jgi:hypothetical protein
MMPHDEFVRTYENGSLGCSTSTLLILRLFLAGKIREKKLSINLFFWSAGFLTLIIACIVGSILYVGAWVLLGIVATFGVYVLVFFLSIGDVVLSAALTSEEFYRLATEKRALWTYPDNEDNSPKLPKITPERRGRRTPR